MKKLFALAPMALLLGCGGGGDGAQESTAGPGSSPPVEVNTAHLTTIKADYASLRSITGAGVTVAVFDSGVNDLHAEFSGKTLNSNSGSFESALMHYTLDELDALGISGDALFDPVDLGDQEDVYGHGTLVTSMVWGDNVGVAPGVDLLMFDVYKTFSPDSSVVLGMLDELSGKGVSFANASLTGLFAYEDSDFTSQKHLFMPLDTDDVGFIIASGNFGLDFTDVYLTNPVDCQTATEEIQQSLRCLQSFSPADEVLLGLDPDLADNVLYVGAVDADLKPAVFMLDGGEAGGSNIPGSNQNIQSRFIMAPGDLLPGAYFDDNESYLDGSGTSLAAPLVSGAAALVKGQFPQLSNAAVLQILLDTADRSFAGYDPALHGRGLLNIEAALTADVSAY